jgi:hypothetical protein
MLIVIDYSLGAFIFLSSFLLQSTPSPPFLLFFPLLHPITTLLSPQDMRIAKMEALEDYNRRASQNIQSYVLARREAVARAAMKGEA